MLRKRRATAWNRVSYFSISTPKLIFVFGNAFPKLESLKDSSNPIEVCVLIEYQGYGVNGLFWRVVFINFVGTTFLCFLTSSNWLIIGYLMIFFSLISFLFECMPIWTALPAYSLFYFFFFFYIKKVSTLMGKGKKAVRGVSNYISFLYTFLVVFFSYFFAEGS